MESRKQSLKAIVWVLSFVVLTSLAVRTQYLLYIHGYTRCRVNSKTAPDCFQVAVFDPYGIDEKMFVTNPDSIKDNKAYNGWADYYSFVLPADQIKDTIRQFARHGASIDVHNISNGKQLIRLTSSYPANSKSSWYIAEDKSFEPSYFDFYSEFCSVPRAILFSFATQIFLWFCIRLRGKWIKRANNYQLIE